MYRYDDPPMRSATFRKQSKLFAYIAGFYPLTFGPRFTSKDWDLMQGLLTRYAEHLSQEAERFQRNPRRKRREAMIELQELVQRDTGDAHHGLVLELLQILVDPKLNAASLRKMGSRAEVPKLRAAKPKLPARPRSKERREKDLTADLSAHTKGKRVKQAKARAGLDNWDEDD